MALLGGLPLVEHARKRMAPQVTKLALAGSNVPGTDLECLSDGEFTGRGPLAGIVMGLKWATTWGATYLVSCPCDVPLVPRNLVALLLPPHIGAASRKPTVLRVNGATEYACALWPTSSLAIVEQNLASGSMSVQNALHSLDVCVCDVAAQNLDGTFANINTKAELHQLEANAEF